MFKSFPNKGFAIGAAKKVFAKLGIEFDPAQHVYMQEVDGVMKWGYDTEYRNTTPVQPVTGNEVSELDEGTSEDDASTAAPAPNMFSGIAATLGNTVTTPAPAAPAARVQRGSYTIEKDRPEQNGIKRPSAGGLCRAVWDAMDAQREADGGAVPTTQNVRDLALMNNWNENNAMIEYYQWRKFNGITGRQKKASAPAAAPAASEPTETQAAAPADA